jgi:hypothetical protein
MGKYILLKITIIMGIHIIGYGYRIGLTAFVYSVCLSRVPTYVGGIGRYTYNLKKSLIEMGLTVQVVCDGRGSGEFSGISEHNATSILATINMSKKSVTLRKK